MIAKGDHQQAQRILVNQLKQQASINCQASEDQSNDEKTIYNLTLFAKESDDLKKTQNLLEAIGQGSNFLVDNKEDFQYSIFFEEFSEKVKKMIIQNDLERK